MVVAISTIFNAANVPGISTIEVFDFSSNEAFPEDLLRFACSISFLFCMAARTLSLNPFSFKASVIVAWIVALGVHPAGLISGFR